jgi:phosphatidylglycerophosphatase A
VLGTLVWLGLWSVLEFAVLEGVVAVLVVVFTLLGTWATARLMPYWGDDPSRVVIDEVVGVWVALLMASDWLTALVALLLFRVFDILKPLGIRSLDRRRGAFWVMADDLLAGVYAAVCLIPLYLIYLWAA